MQQVLVPGGCAWRLCPCPEGARAGKVARDGIFIHPPWQGGTGSALAMWRRVILPRTPSALRAWVGKKDGSDRGDGILFQVAVVDAAGQGTIVAQRSVAEHEWKPIGADLSRGAGQTVGLKLISDVGAADNSSGDWSAWGEPRVEALQPRPVYALKEGEGGSASAGQ